MRLHINKNRYVKRRISKSVIEIIIYWNKNHFESESEWPNEYVLTSYAWLHEQKTIHYMSHKSHSEIIGA